MTDITALAGFAINNNPQPLNITFPDGSQLNFPVSGKASFCGDVEESAKVFFDSILRHRDAQLEAERQRAAGSEEELHKALHREKAAERKLLAAQDSIGVLEGVIARKEFDALKGDQVPVDTGIFTRDELTVVCKARVRDMPENYADHQIAKVALRSLFTAPQKPVVLLPPAYEKSADFTEYHQGWNACRNYMLAEAKEAGGIVSTSDERLMQDMSGIARVGE